MLNQLTPRFNLPSPRLRGLCNAAILGLVVLLPALAAATTVRMSTALGPIDIELYDTEAPKTVTNFLGYVGRGDYDNSYFHRLISGFVLQGGGFRLPLRSPPAGIPTVAPVVNEFSATRSNLRGTVAMAKLGGNPDSATNQWFVNLSNNASNLDNQNGGFTVFGRITTPSMAVVDAIAALRVVNADGGGVLSALPVLQIPPVGTFLSDSDAVVVSSARELPVGAAVPAYQRVFNYIEATYPQYAAPASPEVLDGDGYTYRFYSRTNSYLGLRNSDQQLCYLVPALSPNIECLGSLNDWLKTAHEAGY